MINTPVSQLICRRFPCYTHPSMSGVALLKERRCGTPDGSSFFPSSLTALRAPAGHGSCQPRPRRGEPRDTLSVRTLSPSTLIFKIYHVLHVYRSMCGFSAWNRGFPPTIPFRPSVHAKIHYLWKNSATSQFPNYFIFPRGFITGLHRPQPPPHHVAAPWRRTPGIRHRRQRSKPYLSRRISSSPGPGQSYRSGFRDSDQDSHKFGFCQEMAWYLNTRLTPFGLGTHW